MKIAVNLFPLRPQIAGGHEFYVRNLLDALLRLDAGHFYYILTAPWNHGEIDLGNGSYRKICIEGQPSRSGVIRHLRAKLKQKHWDLYRCAVELNPDVLFCPMMDLQPRNTDIPSIVTIADLQHEFYPQFFSEEELRHRALTMKPSCQLATMVIAVSEHCRNTILERYQLQGEKVRRIYEAAGPAYTRESAAEAWPLVEKQYGLEKGYLFYPANTWPHKNHEMLLLAMNRLRKRGLSPQLVLTGAHIGDFDRYGDLVRQLGLENQVRHLGFMDAALFPGLYYGAACLVFPSLYEGFGIPLVEAMSCGCAVAGSNVCSIPEVAGRGALLFDPRNPDSIADALEQVLCSESVRLQLVEEGRTQAARFSWETAARETLALFETVKTGRAPRMPFGPPQDVVEGFHADGWAGPEILLRNVELSRWRTLLVEGAVSVHCCPLNIQFTVDRQVIRELKIKNPGVLSHRFDIPKAETNSLADIRLVADRHFVPRRTGISRDTRRLSFQIHKLALIDSEGTAMVLRGR